MNKPVFSFCIRREVDGEVVYIEAADVKSVFYEAARQAYNDLPWWKRASSTQIGDCIARAFVAGFDAAIERLKDRTVRM